MPPTAAVTREQRKTARREAILAAAQSVFARKGFDGATIADIARAAGVASGTVYLYYESKIDLFAALNALLLEVVNSAMLDAAVPPDVRGATDARIRAVFETANEHRDLLRIVFLNPDPRTEVARRLNDTNEARLQPLIEILQIGMDAGTVRHAEPAMLARLINSLVIIALYQCFIQADGEDVQSFEDTVIEMIIGALTPS